eukprot:178769_1
MVNVETYKQTAICFALLAVLLCVIIGYYSHLILHKGYKNHPVFKTRRPILLLVYLWSIAFGILSTSIASYAFFEGWTSFEFSVAHEVFVGQICVGSFSWMRMWLLYYDLRKSRFEQNKLLLQQMHSQPRGDPPFYLQNSNIFGNTMRVFLFFFSIFFAVFILTIIGLSLPRSIRVHLLLTLNFSSIFSLVFGMGAILCCIWCSRNRQKFTDIWRIRMELTLLYLTYFFAVQVAAVGEALLRSYYAEDNHLILNMFHFVRRSTAMTMYILIQIVVPIYTYHQVQAPDESTYKAHDTLTSILNDSNLFYQFLQQLVNEFNVENLSFLIELWQFKYRDVDTENDEDVLGKASYVDTLKSLDWKHLPLGECFVKSNGNKYVMSVLLYQKYFDLNSYDCVNLSHATKSGVQTEIEKLMSCDGNAEHVSVHMSQNEKELAQRNQVSCSSASASQDKNHVVAMEWILTIFDVALPDVFDNLHDVLFRFRSTNQVPATTV